MKRSTPPTVLVSSVPAKIRTQHDTQLLMRIEKEKERDGFKTLEIPNKKEMEEILESICQTLVVRQSFVLCFERFGDRTIIYEHGLKQSFLWLKRVNLWLNDIRKHITSKAIDVKYKGQAEKYFGSIEKAWNEKYTITKTKSSSGGIAIQLK